MPNPILSRRSRTGRGRPSAFDELTPVAQGAALAVHHAAKREDGSVDETAVRELVDALGLRGRVHPAGKCRTCGRELPVTSTSGSRDSKVRHGYCGRVCSDAVNGGL